MITKKKILFKNPNCLLTFSLYLIAITSPLVRQANDLSAFSKLCYLLGKVFYILYRLFVSYKPQGEKFTNCWSVLPHLKWIMMLGNREKIVLIQ